MLRTVIPLAILLFATSPLIAQDTLADSSSRQEAYANAVASYERFTGNQTRLYNGIEHVGYTPLLRGHAYFISNQPARGSVWYDGMFYRDVPMLYDLIGDEAVVVYYDSILQLSLTAEKVKAFDLAGHHFIRIVKDSATHRNLSTGFYDLLYQGHTPVLAKRSKTIEERIVDNRVLYSIKEQQRYYIRKDDVYQRVSNYDQLLNMLQDRKKDIRRFLKKQKIRFRKDRETAVIKAVEYYDSLKN